MTTNGLVLDLSDIESALPQSHKDVPLQTSPTTTFRALLFASMLLVLIAVLVLAFTLSRIYRILTRPPSRPSHSRSRESTPGRALGRDPTGPHPRGHLLIVLGSGGHTAEMLGILRSLGRRYLDTRFARRTWVVSSGDAFSTARARDVEAEWESERQMEAKAKGGRSENGASLDIEWDIVTVRRARRVHQSLLSTPVTALGCLWDSIGVLAGWNAGDTGNSKREQDRRRRRLHTGPSSAEPDQYPDLILTNGPGTAVIIVLASLILLFLGLAPVKTPSTLSSTTAADDARCSGDFHPTKSASDLANADADADPRPPREHGAMRSVYIESWARVRTLSLSGKILRFLGARVLVQWEGLAATRMDEGGDNSDSRASRQKRPPWPSQTEYIGPVVT